jgi:catechol 2,3-dioxygenase-like lactoylglutathione lyase family enzyme
MLADIDAQPTLAVQDLGRARMFYEGVLGLQPVGPSVGPVQGYSAGRSMLVVYESPYAGTNKATGVTWPLGAAFDEIVAALQAKGAVFEHYDLPGLAREGDVHIGGDLRLAWLKDPDGNIIHLGSFGAR